MENTNGVSALRHYRLSHIGDNSPCQCHCARPSRRMLYKDSNISAFNIITPCYDLGYHTSLTAVFRLARRIALVGRDHQWYWGIRRRCPTTVSILDGFIFFCAKTMVPFRLIEHSAHTEHGISGHIDWMLHKSRSNSCKAFSLFIGSMWFSISMFLFFFRSHLPRPARPGEMGQYFYSHVFFKTMLVDRDAPHQPDQKGPTPGIVVRLGLPTNKIFNFKIHSFYTFSRSIHSLLLGRSPVVAGSVVSG